jgi:hypothetical protein
MGVLRNYHEDEENYYDLAALYPQPRPTERDYATLYRNYTVTAIYGTKLNKYVNVDGFVKYDRKNGIYYVNFNSNSMNASVLGRSVIRFFTHYRSIDKPLMGGVVGSPVAKKALTSEVEPESEMILGAGGGGGLVHNTVGERRRTNLILNVEGIPKAFQDVTISVMVNPYPTGDPKALVYVSIADPYNEYHVIQHGGFFTLKLKNSKAVVKASYPGYWNDETNEGYMSESAEVVISPEYTMNPLIQTKVFLLLIIAFAVIVSYRFFMSKRMDYYTMFQESGLEEMFKDFFGFK